ncbi:hypothetical protein BD779DRAFT_1207446 [Infundibulicybe gibba]|nr:hypothetical protein BD779DRAFT_1207446 [Infundibulicybe gibba]
MESKSSASYDNGVLVATSACTFMTIMYIGEVHYVFEGKFSPKIPFPHCTRFVGLNIQPIPNPKQLCGHTKIVFSIIATDYFKIEFVPEDEGECHFTINGKLVTALTKQYMIEGCGSWLKVEHSCSGCIKKGETGKCPVACLEHEHFSLEYASFQRTHIEHTHIEHTSIDQTSSEQVSATAGRITAGSSA